MLRKNPVFSRASEKERTLRMCICTIGLILILYTVLTLLAEFSLLDEVRIYILRSAFMVSEIPTEINGFAK